MVIGHETVTTRVYNVPAVPLVSQDSLLMPDIIYLPNSREGSVLTFGQKRLREELKCDPEVMKAISSSSYGIEPFASTRARSSAAQKYSATTLHCRPGKPSFGLPVPSPYPLKVSHPTTFDVSFK